MDLPFLAEEGEEEVAVPLYPPTLSMVLRLVPYPACTAAEESDDNNKQRRRGLRVKRAGGPAKERPESPAVWLPFPSRHLRVSLPPCPVREPRRRLPSRSEAAPPELALWSRSEGEEEELPRPPVTGAGWCAGPPSCCCRWRRRRCCLALLRVFDSLLPEAFK
ncbi:Hypothetical predicted protein [Podarcis lilfordi]|uniref:Uncharacterized protein n=1 Tax=Podarcis lilfordi TaxID=74358 RepID=A0AA35P912_9SAUR|nr:Hypothetical predicted protein [Podarcis lilfordi]